MRTDVLTRCLECELQPLNVKLSDMFDNANDAIIITDLQHRIAGWNRRAEEILGFKAEEVMGKDSLQTIVPKRLRRMAGGVAKALDENKALDALGALLTKDGKEVPVRASIRPILDSSGRKAGFLTIAGDISEMKAMEDRLRGQNRELRASREITCAICSPMPSKEVLQRAVESIVKAMSADAGAIFLLNGNRVTFSPLVHDGASESLMQEVALYSTEGSFSGWIMKSGKGRLIQDARTPKRKSWVLPATIKAGFRSLMGVPLMGKKKVLGTLEVACLAPNRFGRHELLFMEMLAREVAGAVENATLREELRKSLRSKSRLVREARHRLTNNLQSIASLLLTAVESEHWTGDGKATIDSAVRRISGMAAIQQQMDLDELEAIELAEVMDRVELCLREIYGDRHEMTFSIEGSSVRLCPSLASSLAIAINELVWNSCAHGFDPGQKGSIAIEATVADSMAKIEVKDNGKGIPADFDLNRDANTGLSIVRNVVQRDLNGSLILSGGKGTTATITWPAPSHLRC